MKNMRGTQPGRPAENDTPRPNLLVLVVVLVLLLASRERKAGSAGNDASRGKKKSMKRLKAAFSIALRPLK